MTHQIDILLEQAGLDLAELEAISHRRFLYGAIVVMAALSIAFFGMTIHELVTPDPAV